MGVIKNISSYPISESYQNLLQSDITGNLYTALKEPISYLNISSSFAENAKNATSCITIDTFNSYTESIDNKYQYSTWRGIYIDLYNLYTNSLLMPGRQYHITDYRYISTLNNITIGTPESEYPSDVFELVLTATSNHSFDKRVSAVPQPNSNKYYLTQLDKFIIEYDINHKISNDKGVITFMKDYCGNEMPFDIYNQRQYITDGIKTTYSVGTNYPYLFGGTVQWNSTTDDSTTKFYNNKIENVNCFSGNYLGYNSKFYNNNFGKNATFINNILNGMDSFIDSCTLSGENSCIDSCTLNGMDSFIGYCTLSGDGSNIQSCVLCGDDSNIQYCILSGNNSNITYCTLSGYQSYISYCTLSGENSCIDSCTLNGMYSCINSCTLSSNITYCTLYGEDSYISYCTLYLGPVISYGCLLIDYLFNYSNIMIIGDNYNYYITKSQLDSITTTDVITEIRYLSDTVAVIKSINNTTGVESNTIANIPTIPSIGVAVSNITTTTLKVSKNVLNGTEFVLEQGYEYKLSTDTTYTTITCDTITGLTANTSYDVRAYAKTALGTYYSQVITIKTLTA